MQREFWLKHPDLTPPPLIAVSNTVPMPLVSHLLDNKKPTAIKEKYAPGDMISNMQGVWHSLVVPMAFPVWVNGQLDFENGKHVVKPMEPTHTPLVILSCLVNPDFQFDDVMYEMIKLGPNKIVGQMCPPGWFPPAEHTPESELALKQLFIFHFSDFKTKTLPGVNDLVEADFTSGNYYRTERGDVLSLLMLRNCMRTQLYVEMRGIDRIADKHNIQVTYTWDPPVHFAHTIDHDTFDNLWLEAITAPKVLPRAIVRIAYNDFRNKTIIPRLQKAVKVPVCSKADLQATDESVKLVHSNSDAFAKHLKTQPAGSSLEGAIGSCSSAAATFCTGKKRQYLYVPPSPNNEGSHPPKQ